MYFVYMDVAAYWTSSLTYPDLHSAVSALDKDTDSHSKTHFILSSIHDHRTVNTNP